MNNTISTHIDENEEYVRKRLQNCDDCIIRPMLLGEGKKIRCLVVYIEVAVSNMVLEDSETLRLGYPLLPILIALLYPSIKKIAFPASMAAKALSMSSKGCTSEIPIPLSLINSISSSPGISHI